MKKTGNRVANIDIDPRRAARVELKVRGELITQQGRKDCLVEDISLSGARISGFVHLAPGDSGILKCRELDILTEVKWRSEQDIGLSFAESLDGGDKAEGEDEIHFVEEAERRANNRRFLRLFWNVS